ncbi:MAG: serine/threonine-protein kinase [Candidatus Obscuribacterales bacterium]
MPPSNEQFDTTNGADRTISSIGARGRTVTVFKPGLIVDQTYQLIDEIGQGAMGVVFSCTHLVLQKDYALKLLLANELSSEAWNRFQIEAKALAKLNHHGIVGIHNMGIHHGLDDKTPYYVMDLLSGENLNDLIRKSGPLPVGDALSYFMQVANALQSAHTQGVVHRDIKPSNLMLVRDQSNRVAQLKIVDFGIARVNQSGHGAQSQTATGVIIGTPFYMSPEQCRGERVDERSDIYSFGCTLFEALTGEPPFKGGNAFQTFMMHQTDTAPTLASKRNELASGEEFSDGLEALVEKALQKNVAERYQSMAQLLHDLERVIQGKQVTSRGMRRTTVTDVELFDTSRLQPRDRESYDDSEDYDEDDFGEEKSLLPSRLLLAASLLAAGGLIALLAVTFWKPPAAHVKANSEIADVFAEYEHVRLTPPAVMKRIGTSPAEAAFFSKFDWPAEGEYESACRKKVESYMVATSLPGVKPIRYKKPTGYQFPSEFYLGAIQFDNGPIKYATGFMPLGYGQEQANEHEVHYYTSVLSQDYVQILDRFSADDLTGIDLKVNDVPKAIAELKKWRRLKDLSFFNGITKCLPTYENRIEDSPLTDAMLPSLAGFTNLRSLGVAGAHVSGPAVAKMPLLSRLQTLKIKGIKNVQPLLETLPRLDNIEELWLMSLALEDRDLEPLTRMKNLKSLRITRSQLTPASIEYFKRMPSLVKLKLDRSWSKEDIDRFKQALPGYEFESVFDFRFWKLGPEKAPSEP